MRGDDINPGGAGNQRRRAGTAAVGQQVWPVCGGNDARRRSLYGPRGARGGEGVPESAKTVVMGEFNVESGKENARKGKAAKVPKGQHWLGLAYCKPTTTRAYVQLNWDGRIRRGSHEARHFPLRGLFPLAACPYCCGVF